MSLLCATTFFYAWASEPVLHIPGLTTLDNSGIINVSKIVEFHKKIEGILEYVFKTKDKGYTLRELVDLVETGQLTQSVEVKFFDAYTGKFSKLSRPYFVEISPLKPILVKILSLWAEQRNRPESLLLLWAGIETGKEEQFLREYTPNLKAFYTFVVDLGMLLEDITGSCPKSYAKYLQCKKIVEEEHQHKK